MITEAERRALGERRGRPAALLPSQARTEERRSFFLLGSVGEESYQSRPHVVDSSDESDGNRGA